MLIDFKIYLLTWNVKNKSPIEDLNELLGFKGDFYGTQEMPDIFAIGVKPSDIFLEEPWLTTIKKLLSKWDYIKLKQIRLQGIFLMMFVKREHLLSIRRVQTTYTRTGFGGLWGNKGGVSIRLNINGCSICIVNSHLAAHDEYIQQRITDYNTILDSQKFDDPLTPTILSHDYVFWMGDLNFRINELTAEDIYTRIINAKANKDSKYWQSSYEQISNYDQLTIVRNDGKAFSEFTESPPTFPPTYRFIAGTDNYDFKSRKPAWTDRILFRYTKDAYQNVTLNLNQIHYCSIEKYKQSDHKPVSSLFSFKVFNHNAFKILNIVEPLRITFLPITGWKVYQDCTAYYKIISEPPHPYRNWSAELIDSKFSNWDWIGLYRENFNSIDEPICYVWANPQALNDSEMQTILATEDYEDEANGPWFSVTFDDQALLVPNLYRLVYVGGEFHDVLGMSEPFEINY